MGNINITRVGDTLKTSNYVYFFGIGRGVMPE